MTERLTQHLPRWLQAEAARCGERFEDDAARMAYVIALARRNVEEGTGGPFGAAVFDRESGALVAVGTNLVVRSHCSHAHAEMVALALAEQRLECFSLGEVAGRSFELFSSCEPCAMCFGAIPWSGVTRVVSAATDADARKIGFEEGPKLPDWAAALRERGIEVDQGVLREEAVAVFDAYVESGGIIYNGAPRFSAK